MAVGMYVVQLFHQNGTSAGALAIIPPGSPDGPPKWVFSGVPNPLGANRGTPQSAGQYATYLLANGVAVATLSGFDLSGMPQGAQGYMSVPSGPINQYNWTIVNVDSVGAAAYNALKSVGLPTHPLLLRVTP